jgi:hypothetical protein
MRPLLLGSAAVLLCNLVSSCAGSTQEQASDGSAGANQSGGGGTRGAAGATQPSGGNGGGPGGSAPTKGSLNVVPITVDSGPAGGNYINGAFITLTLCEPGSSNCQDIDHVLVDTGSTGVRVLESVLTLHLPEATSSTGKALAECLPFVSGMSWGAVRLADVKVADETASTLSIHVIGERSYVPPSMCGGPANDDLDTLGANGIFGIGVLAEDCGPTCTRATLTGQGYYECSSATSCTPVGVPLVSQISNPITAFPVDNNGSFIQLPPLPPTGAVSASGFLVFGIGTRPNNGLGSATVIPVDGSGFAKTISPEDGPLYRSFVDSGSNGIFFNPSTDTDLPRCVGEWAGFYCLKNGADYAATMIGLDGNHADLSFTVTDASELSRTNHAFSNLAGPGTSSFDWGLPFYFGRKVFTAIESRSTPAGAGPYVAF